MLFSGEKSVMMKNQFILRINFERKKTQEDNFQMNCSHKKLMHVSWV